MSSSLANPPSSAWAGQRELGQGGEGDWMAGWKAHLWD
ncbi:unnamed protein product [Gulo gulo]|uniref:Uncharacterized protein n=1 Tax=Gulo gulo TaxID=48420 RepID=A0A9X9LMR5_GULGU|nr:unnamed protein product [Gulo gulo]